MVALPVAVLVEAIDQAVRGERIPFDHQERLEVDLGAVQTG